MQKIIIMVTVVLFIVVGVAFAAISTIETVSHTSTLSGKVSAIELVKEGQKVTEGQVLVNVETIVGIAPTARSQIDGTIIKVFVIPGQHVTAGEPIVIVGKK